MRVVVLTIRYEREYDEYSVKVTRDGKRRMNEDYFALDKDDAISTQAFMVKEYERQGYQVKLKGLN
jgi:hypothetical protein